MHCFACDRPSTRQCQRCGNHYCLDHGSGLCAACLDPVRAAPSSGAFRIALAGLLGASVLALWLLVRPPSVPGESSGIIQQPEESPGFTPGLTPAGATPTPGPTLTGGVTPTPGTATEAPTAAPTEVPTDAPSGPIEYIAVEGDTWFGIAAAFGVDAESLAAYNGYTLEEFFQPGDVILIPQ
ncbi:MAG: LysM peptidoglycan-binding domain-containing protein [Dehalococcoidia bacterium]